MKQSDNKEETTDHATYTPSLFSENAQTLCFYWYSVFLDYNIWGIIDKNYFKFPPAQKPKYAGNPGRDDKGSVQAQECGLSDQEGASIGRAHVLQNQGPGFSPQNYK